MVHLLQMIFLFIFFWVRFVENPCQSLVGNLRGKARLKLISTFAHLCKRSTGLIAVVGTTPEFVAGLVLESRLITHNFGYKFEAFISEAHYFRALAQNEFPVFTNLIGHQIEQI